MSTSRDRFEKILAIPPGERTQDMEDRMAEYGMALIADTHRIVSSIWHKMASGDPRRPDTTTVSEGKVKE